MLEVNVAEEEKRFWAACSRATWGKSLSLGNDTEQNNNGAPHLKLKWWFWNEEKQAFLTCKGADEGKNHKEKSFQYFSVAAEGTPLSAP